MNASRPICHVVAGPNGSGKSTFALRYLPRWAGAVGADRYIADCIALFREYGWDWTYHAFREWEGWSVEHEPVSFGTTPDSFRPSADNPRKRALLEGLKGASPSAEHAP